MKTIVLSLFLFIGVAAWAQPENDVITPENARSKQKEQHDKIEKDYLENVEKHQDAQGKKGKRQMKRHMKKSIRSRRLGNIPWYKRIWIRRQ
jgi:type VI protein secretion system component VasK